MTPQGQKTLLICLLLGLLFWLAAFRAIGQTGSTAKLKFGPRLVASLKAYTHDGKKTANIAISAFSGAWWGLHEAIYADPWILEKRFGFSPYSWGGSEAWQSKYPGGRYTEDAKPVLWRDKTNVFREAKKTSAFFGRWGPVCIGVRITLHEKRHVLDYLANAGAYVVSSLVTYRGLREW